MSSESKAFLFYGITLTLKQSVNLLKKFKSLIDFENLDMDLDENDPYQICILLDKLGKKFGFETIDMGWEGYEHLNFPVCISVYKNKSYEFDGVKTVKIPSQKSLDSKWEKVSNGIKITKKPRWLLASVND